MGYNVFMKKDIIIVVVVIAIIVVGLFWAGKYKNNVQLAALSPNQAGGLPPAPAASPKPASTSPAPMPAAQPKPVVNPPALAPGTDAVNYTESGFSPAVLTISKGETVTFVNQSSAPIRVASNPHPLHNGYPTTGGCVSSTFDSCSDIRPGGSWSFKFDLAGRWGYHNHLNPSEQGTIVVQ